MMTLTASGLLVVRRADRSVIVERGITAAAIEARLIALGYRPMIARAIVAGALGSRAETAALARAAGLAAPIDGSEARLAGLIR